MSSRIAAGMFGAGDFVEASFLEPIRYPVVGHLMADAKRGAHGFVEVTE